MVPCVLGEHLSQVLLAEDQHVIQALAAKRAHKPLRERVRPRRLDRVGAENPVTLCDLGILADKAAEPVPS